MFQLQYSTVYISGFPLFVFKVIFNKNYFENVNVKFV